MIIGTKCMEEKRASLYENGLTEEDQECRGSGAAGWNCMTPWQHTIGHVHYIAVGRNRYLQLGATVYIRRRATHPSRAGLR